MAKAKLVRRVMHSPDDLIDLVSNVEAYPEFINLLSAVRVSNRTSPMPGVETFDAEANVSFKFVSETFRSSVKVDRNLKRIDVAKANRSGAVKALTNNWVFHELSDGSSIVDFYVEVKLKAFPLEILLREKFDKAGTHLMNLFEAKAGQVCPRVGQDNLDVAAEAIRLGLEGVTLGQIKV